MTRRIYDRQLARIVVSHTRNSASQQLARKRMLKRHGSICQACGFAGYVELHHHLAACEGGTFADDNLVLLCERCHKIAHYGTERPYERIFAEKPHGPR